MIDTPYNMEYFPTCHGVGMSAWQVHASEWQSRASTAMPMNIHASLKEFDDQPINGGLSIPLKCVLESLNLTEIDHLLRTRGIKTLAAFESMNRIERSSLLSAARLVYRGLGLFPSSVKNTLDSLFGDDARQGMLDGRTMQSGVMPYDSRLVFQGVGGHQGMLTSTHDPSELLFETLEDDTHLKRSIGPALHGVRRLVGWDRHDEAHRRINRSHELARESALEAVRGFAALCIEKKYVRNRVDKEALKKAKKALRDIILWCCVSICGGLDSKPALVRALEEVIEQMDLFDGIEHLVSQCTNGYRRVREEVARARLLERGCTSGSSGCGPHDHGAGGSRAGGVTGAVTGSSGVGACLHEQGLQNEGGGGSQSGAGSSSSSDDVKCCGLGATAGDGRSLSPARRRSRSPRRRDGGESAQIAEVVEMLRAIKRDLEGFKPGYQQQKNSYMSGRYQQNNPHFLDVTSGYAYMPGSHQHGGSDCEDDKDYSDSDDSDGYDAKS